MDLEKTKETQKKTDAMKKCNNKYNKFCSILN